MAANWEALFDEIISDLKDQGQDFWENLQDDQRPIVETAAKNLAQALVDNITSPSAVNEELIRANRSIIASEGWYTALEVQERLKTAAIKALKALTGGILAIL